MSPPVVLRTKIIPPARSTRTLYRERVQKALSRALDYRLTTLQAGAGYGKSTEVASLVETQQPLIWYQINEEDSDPLVFLLHLCHAIRIALPALSGLPIPYLESWEGVLGPLPSGGVLDQVINALSLGTDTPTLLVLDDIHLAIEASEIAHLLDRLIGMAPRNLHVLTTSRKPIQLPNLSRWRAQGDVLSIDQATLAFRPDEIARLYSEHYDYELTPEEALTLHHNTEGWAIAVQLVWQSLRSTDSLSIEEALGRAAPTLENLFDMLAGEVFNGQPEDVREFMLVSATLREMTAEACNSLRGSTDSALMMDYLHRQELFVFDMRENGDEALRLRYHHIFHNFLRQKTAPPRLEEQHRRAAAYFETIQDYDTAIYHCLRGHDLESAARLLDEYGAQLLSSGRLDTLSGYINALPPEVLKSHPALLIYLGDLARLHSRFQEALGWYQQAENLNRERGLSEGIVRALRGQARVYLDTVNPSKAEEILQQTLRMTDGIESREAQARLYELLAENRLNAGRIDDAERLRAQAESLRAEGPSDSQLLFRVLLRTGNILRARQELEARAEVEKIQPVHTPRAHRETTLLLSLVYAIQGEAEKAYATALDGTQRGEELHSPFITAVGHMRQGHALMLMSGADRYAKSRQHFESSNEISRLLAVPRLVVEAAWGLCRAYGFEGDLAQAEEAARRGLEIATQAGDEWIASLIRLAMGAAIILSGKKTPRQDIAHTESWLNHAAKGFMECSDTFGLTAARLWLCLGWYRQRRVSLPHGRNKRSTSQDQGTNASFEQRGIEDFDTLLENTLPKVLESCRQNGYDFLLTRPTLLGPPDERVLVPLLILARDNGWETRYASRLLDEIGLGGISLHPGYGLRMRTLGEFQVWRGDQAIPGSGWRREKARQMLQIFITFRRAPLDREQIIEYLWPDMDPGSAQRNFKVTLNALYQVLEPSRDPGSDSAFILRQGSTYSLRPGADIRIDAQAFEDKLSRLDHVLSNSGLQAGIATLESALNLYTGEYLSDARYETWPAAERENLSVLFLRAADRLADLYIQGGGYKNAIQVCDRILAQDNCWERAYRQLMLCYANLGDLGQVARTYRRCRETLQKELEVKPSADTESLYKELTQADSHTSQASKE